MGSAPPSDDLYSDSGAPPAEQEGAEPKPEEKSGSTALIPKTLLAGKEFKPGEEVVLKIVADHGDEVEVSYSTGGGEEGGSESATPESAPPPSEGSVDSMME